MSDSICCFCYIICTDVVSSVCVRQYMLCMLYTMYRCPEFDMCQTVHGVCVINFVQMSSVWYVLDICDRCPEIGICQTLYVVRVIYYLPML